MGKKLFVIVIIVVLALIVYFGFSDEKAQEKTMLDSPKLPIIGKASEIRGIFGWINSEPLTLEKLKGKVVLVDFWTYSCINCIRTLPYVKEWYEKYKNNGFVLLGIHSPEFNFEKERKNVEEAVKKYGLTYPVALDNDHKTWNAFNNRYWPAHYLIDLEGNIRYQHFGEGKYAETENAIQNLLLEAGLLTVDKTIQVTEPPPPAGGGADFSGIGTPEIYLGYLRINNVGNMDENVPSGQPFTFAMPKEIEKNKFYFVGTWKIGPEFSEYVGKRGETGKLVIHYKASKAHMVLAPNDKEAEVELILDGKPIGSVKVRESKLYTLADTVDNYDWHVLEIIIKTPGLRAFSFTFG